MPGKQFASAWTLVSDTCEATNETLPVRWKSSEERVRQAASVGRELKVVRPRGARTVEDVEARATGQADRLRARRRVCASSVDRVCVCAARTVSQV